MFQGMLVNLAVNFIARQLTSYGESIDWDKLRADLDVRVRALVPGTFLDDEAVGLMNYLLDVAKGALSEGDLLKGILEELATQKYSDALLSLKNLLLGQLHADAGAQEAELKNLLMA